MKQTSGPAKKPAEAVIKDIRRATRRQFSSEEAMRRRNRMTRHGSLRDAGACSLQQREESMSDVHSTPSPDQRAARQRVLGASRKRGERDRKREAGQPDLNALDRAIVESLRAHILNDRPVSPLARLIRVEDLVKTISLHLLRRSWEAHATGAEPVVYTREGVAAAIKARLMQPPKRPGKPAVKEGAAA